MPKAIFLGYYYDCKEIAICKRSICGMSFEIFGKAFALEFISVEFEEASI